MPNSFLTYIPSPFSIIFTDEDQQSNRGKMCFEASSMASSPRPDPMQFLLSPRESTADAFISHKDPPALDLIDYDSLPDFLKHNEFIINHYRSEWPLKETVLSLFSIHNETLNIWTHLIGFIIFLILTGYAVSIFPLAPNPNNSVFLLLSSNSSSTFSASFFQTPPVFSRWPFYIYLAGAMFCLLMSSGCHLLSCHSSKASYILLRLDFTGISVLIVSSFYPLVYYAFACHPFFRNVYLCSITAFGISAIIVSLMPVFDSPQFRPARAVLFSCMAASGIIPIAHKMMAFGHRPEAVVTTGYEGAMAMFYGIGVLVYAARVPERWLPGRFDLAGHSHQLFHVLVVAGAFANYLAGVVYLTWREAEGC